MENLSDCKFTLEWCKLLQTAESLEKLLDDVIMKRCGEVGVIGFMCPDKTVNTITALF